MSSLLLTMLLASVMVDVTLSDGQPLSGELTSLSDDGVEVTLDNGQARRIARAGVREIRFGESEDVESPFAFVQLIDDSVVPSQSVQIEDGKLLADSGLSSSWTTQSSVVRAIRWPKPAEKTDEQWNEILGTPSTEDRLVIRREASLDYLKGVILSVSKDAVQFEYSGDTVPVPLAKVAGIILARKEVELPAPRLRLSTRTGGQWMLRSAKLNNDRLEVTTTANANTRLPLDQISRISFPQLGAVFLTDLEPTDVAFQPFFGSTLDRTLTTLHTPQYDVSYDGGPIRLASTSNVTGWRQFRRGVAMRSRTEMVYRLAGKYQRFMATAGIAPGMPSQAEVELKLFADDRQIFSQKLGRSDEPTEIDVSVVGAKRLKLLVDYGANIHVGDRIHLGDARLVK